jgi:glutaredoxin
MSDAKKITLYGADWCSDCTRSKGYLDAAAKEMIETLTGAKSIPVIIFEDGSYLIEPSNAELGAKAGVPQS